MKKKIGIALLVLVGVGVGVWMWMHRTPFLYAGTIEVTEVTISPQVTGVLAGMPFQEGDAIKKGDVVVDIAGEDYKLARDIAEREFVRAKKLNASGSMPDDAFDKFRFKRDDTALKAAWCQIRSPLNGVVLDRYREPGELVTPATKILTLADMDDVWAMVYVPQTLVASIKLGDRVDAFLPELGLKRLEGRVAHVRDEAEFTPKNVQTREERTRLVYGVKVAFKNEDRILKPGMTVEVRLPE